MEDYLSKKNVGPILKDLVIQLCTHKPENAVEFMVNYLNNKYLGNNTFAQHQKPQQPRERPIRKGSNIDRMDSDMEEESNSNNVNGRNNTEGNANAPKYPIRSGRRGAICAEPIGTSTVSLRVVPKSKEASDRLSAALKKHIMFAHLEDEERQAVFNAMFESRYKKGDVIIRQGDEGDNFYVVEDGECDIYVSKPDGSLQHVAVVGKDGSFGELALIFGSPRAATVKAKVDCSLWAIDRVTYRQVLMRSTIEKRKIYEGFLEKVPILEQLTKWERMVVADALETHTFEKGQVIMREGTVGDRFYIIVEGEAEVFQQRESGVEQIATLGKSNYFGEIALLTDRPRAATVVAVGHLKCVGLDRDRFNRVLGPCENILRRNMENYNRYMADKI